MKPIDRLFKYLTHKNIRPTRLEKDIGLSNGYLGITLKRSGDLGSSILENIINYCLDLNLEWLVTGKGDMLKCDSDYSNSHTSDSSIVEEPQPQISSCKLCEEKEKRIIDLQRFINTQAECIDSLRDQVQMLKTASPASNAGQKRKSA